MMFVERFVRVLEIDPDLGLGIEPSRLMVAAAHALAPIERLPAGRCEFSSLAGHGELGLLILTGLLACDVTLGKHRRRRELLGPRDFVQPGVDLERPYSVPVNVSWHVIEPVEVAVLDRRFVARVSAFPEIAANLIQRGMIRAQWLGACLALSNIRRLEERLHVLLWLCADRWGRVTPDGVTIDVRLTHSTLAAVLSAERPSVTVAVGRLKARGWVAHDRNQWLLRGEPPLTEVRMNGDLLEP